MSGLTKESMQAILEKEHPELAALMEQERNLATIADQFNRPWKVVLGGQQRSHNVPRIVDRTGAPIMSFGNQRHNWGQERTKEIAEMIVDAVNSRDDTTWKDPQHQHHFAAMIEYGIMCDRCGGTMPFLYMGTSNTPLGHDMVYGEFGCETCKRKFGYPSGFRYNAMGEMRLVYHIWDGERFVRAWDEECRKILENMFWNKEDDDENTV